MRKLILIVLIIFYSNVSLSEESIYEYLNETKASLMDVGLDNLTDLFLRYSLMNSRDYFVSPYWSKDENFVLRITQSKIIEAEQAKQVCEGAIAEVKSVLGVDPETNNPEDGVASNFGAFFESYGSQYGDSVSEFRKNMDLLVTLKGYVQTKNDAGFIECISKLKE